MKIVGFLSDTGVRLGLIEGDMVVDLQAADSRVPSDLGVWLAENDGELAPLREIARPIFQCAQLLKRIQH